MPSIIVPHEDLGTFMFVFVLGTTFLASVNKLHRLKAKSKAKQQAHSRKDFT